MSKKSLIILLSSIGGAILIGAIVLVVALTTGTKGYRSIKIYERSGDVTVERDLKKYEGVVGMRLLGKDIFTVSTDSDSVIKLDEDKFIYVKENTELILESSKKDSSYTNIIVCDGGIVVEIKNKLKDNESFSVASSNSVLGIRGTTFSTNVSHVGNETITDYCLLEGKIELSVLEKNGSGDIKASNIIINPNEKYTVVVNDKDLISNDEMSKFVSDLVDGKANSSSFDNPEGVNDNIKADVKIDLQEMSENEKDEINGALGIFKETEEGLILHNVYNTKYEYDGAEHSPVVDVLTPNVDITYSTDGTSYSQTLPKFKDAGTYKVYYKLTREGYKDVAESFDFVITKAKTNITGTPKMACNFEELVSASLESYVPNISEFTNPNNIEGSLTIDGSTKPDTSGIYKIKLKFTPKDSMNYDEVSLSYSLIVQGDGEEHPFILYDVQSYNQAVELLEENTSAILKLCDDIDFTNQTFVALDNLSGSFTGTFTNAKQYEISGIKMEASTLDAKLGIINNALGAYIEGIIVNDMDITVKNNTSSIGAAGLVAEAKDATITGCTVKNSHITSNESAIYNVGFIVGYSDGSSIINCDVDDSEIKANKAITSENIGGVGGIVGTINLKDQYSDATDFSGNYVTGVKISTNTYAGGVAGYVICSTDKAVIRDFIVTDAEVEAINYVGSLFGRAEGLNNNLLGIEIDDSDVKTYGSYSGGVVGYLDGFTIDGIEMTESSITLSKGSGLNSPITCIGGTIGYVKDSLVSNVDADVELNLTNELVNIKGNVDTADITTLNAGGFAGKMETSYISSSTFTGMVYSPKESSNVGGVVGYALDTDMSDITTSVDVFTKGVPTSNYSTKSFLDITDDFYYASGTVIGYAYAMNNNVSYENIISTGSLTFTASDYEKTTYRTAAGWIGLKVKRGSGMDFEYTINSDSSLPQTVTAKAWPDGSLSESQIATLMVNDYVESEVYYQMS